MQNDCYLVSGDGWKESAHPRLIVEDRNKKTKAKPDFTLGRKKYQAELIPPALVTARYYAPDQAAIEGLEAQLATVAQQIEEMAEEHGGEGGLLEDAKNDKDKLTEDEIKNLVVGDKWLATLAAAVQGELDRVSQTLTGRIREFAERDATPLPRLVEEVDSLASKVGGHLTRMGFKL